MLTAKVLLFKLASIKLYRLTHAYLRMMATRTTSHKMKCFSQIRYLGLQNVCSEVYHFEMYIKSRHEESMFISS